VTFFPVPDEFYADPQFAGLPGDALGLWTRAGSWSAHHLTDGFVPSTMLPVLLQQLDPQSPHMLVERGVWKRARGGFQFVYWPKQASKDHVEAKREAARVRQEKARRSKGVASRRDTRVTDGVTHKGSHTGGHGSQSSPSLPSGERWTADAVHGGQDFPGDGSDSARAAAQARALAIANCSLCDDRGYIGARLCDHDPAQAAVNANGVAKAWAVLGGKPSGGGEP
jgi:hypothetical protein